MHDCYSHLQLEFSSGSVPGWSEQDMRCPYLKDSRVKFCRVSAFRKMIADAPGQADREKCSSEDYAACELARQHGMPATMESSCPFLQESQAQYCSAASVTRFIPYSANRASRCGSESHQSCEMYLVRRGSRDRTG